MKNDEIRLINLRSLIAEKGTIAAVADASGTAAAYLSQITTGNLLPSGKPRVVGTRLARKLEIGCAKPDGWMDQHHEKLAQGAMQNYIPAPDVRDYVPLISMVQAGNFSEAIDSLHVGDYFEKIPTSYPKKRHTFALEVSGESMMPRFPPGMRLIVEPDMEYQSGDFVIAKNGGDATFKQIMKDGGVWYLKPLNPQFPTLPLADAHVIGVVREAVIKFR